MSAIPNLQYIKSCFYLITDLLTAAGCRPQPKVFFAAVRKPMSSEILTCEIADFRTSHAFRKCCLFTEISNMLRTDY